MKTMQFKTNAKCKGCISAIGEKLNTRIAPDAWSIDLGSPDKILKVTADVPEETIIEAVQAAGFKIEKYV